MFILFLTYHTNANGRAYATVLRLSSSCLWRCLLWPNGAS